MQSLHEQARALRRRIVGLEQSVASLRVLLERLEAAIPALPSGRDYGAGVVHLRTCACERCCSTRLEQRKVSSHGR
jgi:hypothetical protein